jgi:hypothetical protein
MKKLRKLVSKSALVTATASIMSAVVLMADGGASGSAECKGQTVGKCSSSAQTCTKVEYTVTKEKVVKKYSYYKCCTDFEIFNGTC